MQVVRVALGQTMRSRCPDNILRAARVSFISVSWQSWQHCCKHAIIFRFICEKTAARETCICNTYLLTAPENKSCMFIEKDPFVLWCRGCRRIMSVRPRWPGSCSVLSCKPTSRQGGVLLYFVTDLPSEIRVHWRLQWCLLFFFNGNTEILCGMCQPL